MCVCVCLHVCMCPLYNHVNVCVYVPAADDSFLKAVSLLLCLPCRYNYKGHLTLKPHSLSPPRTYGQYFSSS